MAESVKDWNGGRHNLTDDVYFHWTDDFSILCHNAKLGQGLTMSVSVLAANSGIAGFTTPYAAVGSEKDKEAVWEAVRSSSFGHMPSRDRAFFCFSSREAAQTAKFQWFPDANKKLLEVRLTENAAFCSVDSRWLDCSRPDWASASHNYWMGLETRDPLIETIVSGPIYFPDWQSFSLLR